MAIAYEERDGLCARRQGQFVVTATSIEGSLVYASSSVLRDQIAARGKTTIWLDLAPDLDGYLLTACFASGRAAAQGMLRRLTA